MSLKQIREFCDKEPKALLVAYFYEEFRDDHHDYRYSHAYHKEPLVFNCDWMHKSNLMTANCLVVMLKSKKVRVWEDEIEGISLDKEQVSVPYDDEKRSFEPGIYGKGSIRDFFCGDWARVGTFAKKYRDDVFVICDHAEFERIARKEFWYMKEDIDKVFSKTWDTPESAESSESE